MEIKNIKKNVKMKIGNIFIENNHINTKPKETELLNLFSTYLTQNEKPFQLKYTDIKNPINESTEVPKNKKKEKKIVTFYSDKNTPHYISSVNSSLSNSSSISNSNSNSNILFHRHSKSELNNSINQNEEIKTIKRNLKNKKYTIREIKNFRLQEISDPYLDMNLEFYLPVMNFDEISKVITHRRFNSQKFHEIKSNFLISKGMENDKITMKKIQNAFKEERSPEEIEECYDNFFNEDIKIKKLRKLVLDFLQAKDNRLNQVQIEKNVFFLLFENRVNFIFDSYKVPNIKNHFIDLSNKLLRINNYPNIIDNGIREYLNIRKFTIQRNEDIKFNKNINYETNIKLKKKVNKKDDTYEKDNFLRFQEEEDNNTKIYELDSFFIHKYTRYPMVHITGPKIRNLIYNAKITRVQLEEEELENLKDKITFREK